MKLHPGDIFGRFRIEELLGEGGMGAVYRAEDTKLRRRVALKLLRPDRSPDETSRREAADRLLREARAAALIDHHNAVTVHDVGEIDGTPYIAMEYVDGRTLRAYVGDASVPVPTRTRWLVQIARALEAAHGRGVVHRDVKPENVMVRDDGTVKVLDFGLARMENGEGRSPAATWSGAEFEAWYATISRGDGGLAGTPRYMAPEQLRGEASQQADQFGWGVTAYELLAGVPPWRGDPITYSELLARLERDASPLDEAAPDVSPEIARVVQRALHRDPSDRFPSMGDLVRALEAATHGEPRPPGRAARVIVAIVASAAIAGALGAAAFGRATSSPSAPAFHATNVRRITFGDVCEEYPSFTPDGTHVVFDKVRNSDLVVVTMDLATGAEHDVTDGHGWDMAPQVSPDGTEVAYLHAPAEGAPQALVVDIDGKRPPRVVCAGRIRPSFSLDGRAIWCGDGEHPRRVEIATGSVTRKLDMPPSAGVALVRETGDGRVLALVPTEQQTSVRGLALFERDGTLRWLLQDRLEEALDLTPDNRFAFASRVTPAGSRELVAVPLSGGPPVPIAGADIAPSQGFRFAPDRRAVVWSTCHETTSVVRADEHGALVPLLHGAHAWRETAASSIPGTRKLVVLSERDGTSGAWVVDRDDREHPTRLPVQGAPRSVSISPDGRLAVFAMANSGIVVAAIDGEMTRTLTSDPGDGKARFTHDGRTVVFSRAVQGGVRRVFAVDVGGGDARPLLELGSTEPAPSPVDDRIAYLAGSEETKRLPMIFDPKAGLSTRLSAQLGETEGSYESLAFSGDGRRVGFLKGAGNTIVEVDAVTGEVVRTIDAGTSSLLRLSYDGNDPVVGREQWIGNLWMADGRFE